MVLVIDNYDSFTYNLVQYLGELNVDLQVHRNDQITLEQVRQLNPERILVSPGPCSPRESGLSNDIIHEFGPKIPLFGVCDSNADPDHFTAFIPGNDDAIKSITLILNTVESELSDAKKKRVTTGRDEDEQESDPVLAAALREKQA